MRRECEETRRGPSAIAEGPLHRGSRRTRSLRRIFPSRWSGAGGIRTPVPKRAEGRVYACSRPLISLTTRRDDDPSREQGMRMSRSSKACQPFGPSPMFCGIPPHRASGGIPSRRSGRESVLRVGSRKVCILFTWHGCSTARHDDPYLTGRCRIGPDRPPAEGPTATTRIGPAYRRIQQTVSPARDSSPADAARTDRADGEGSSWFDSMGGRRTQNPTAFFWPCLVTSTTLVHASCPVRESVRVRRKV